MQCYIKLKTMKGLVNIPLVKRKCVNPHQNNGYNTFVFETFPASIGGVA